MRRDYKKEYERRKHKNEFKFRRQREKLKYRARMIVNNLLAAGKLSKEPCFLCGEPVTAAHHVDYEYPEKIIWLCRKHHEDVHHEIK